VIEENPDNNVTSTTETTQDAPNTNSDKSLEERKRLKRLGLDHVSLETQLAEKTKLENRTKRFGSVANNEHDDALKKRAERFGVANDDFKRKQRAEKFGLVGGDSKKKSTRREIWHCNERNQGSETKSKS